MEKIGFSLTGSYPQPIPQVIRLLADTGFYAVSPSWDADGNWKEAVREAHAVGLVLQSLHGPLRNMPAMWSRDPEVFQPILQSLLQSVSDCADAEIPSLVVHPWNGIDQPYPPQLLCFDHFDQLVTLAENRGIRIAFENLEGPEFLAAVMERYKSNPAVGYCWDAGHEHCYAPGTDFLSLYGDRLIMTHLNDNLGVTDPSGRLQGTDDLHLLPYDGKLDWVCLIRQLKAAKPQQILNFELKIRSKGDRCILDLYSKMPFCDYIREAYHRASKLAKNYFEA